VDGDANSQHRAGDNSLVSIGIVSEDDIWAGGSYKQDDAAHSLLLHWDGTAWTIEPIQDVGVLSDIEVVSPTDIWIAAATPLHWDGTSWQTVASPFPLHHLSAVASDDIWGLAGDLTVMHWDGKAWTEKITFINSHPLAGNESFSDIVATGSDDVWVVGNEWFHAAFGMIEHWNGTTGRYLNLIPSGRVSRASQAQVQQMFGWGDACMAVLPRLRSIGTAVPLKLSNPRLCAIETVICLTGFPVWMPFYQPAFGRLAMSSYCIQKIGMRR
jgi:hypothetical protein